MRILIFGFQIIENMIHAYLNLRRTVVIYQACPLELGYELGTKLNQLAVELFRFFEDCTERCLYWSINLRLPKSNAEGDGKTGPARTNASGAMLSVPTFSIVVTGVHTPAPPSSHQPARPEIRRKAGVRKVTVGHREISADPPLRAPRIANQKAAGRLIVAHRHYRVSAQHHLR